MRRKAFSRGGASLLLGLVKARPVFAEASAGKAGELVVDTVRCFCKNLAAPHRDDNDRLWGGGLSFYHVF